MSGTRDQFFLWATRTYDFVREVPFGGLAGNRKWRFDLALPTRKLAVEYQGLGPGHQWAGPQAADYEKWSEAALLGWTLILCNATLVNNAKCLQLIEWAIDDTRQPA
jgi:hypothetical protein